MPIYLGCYVRSAQCASIAHNKSSRKINSACEWFNNKRVNRIKINPNSITVNGRLWTMDSHEVRSLKLSSDGKWKICNLTAKWEQPEKREMDILHFEEIYKKKKQFYKYTRDNGISMPSNTACDNPRWSLTRAKQRNDNDSMTHWNWLISDKFSNDWTICRLNCFLLLLLLLSGDVRKNSEIA